MPILLLPQSAAASGSTFTRTPADVAGVTDTPVARTITPTGVEPVGVTDSVSPVLTSALIDRTVSDTAGVSDAVAVAVTLAVFAADTVGVVDAAGVVVSYARGLVDTAGVTDAAGAASTFNRDIADAVGVPDSVSGGSATSQSLTDTVGATDTVTVSVTYGGAVADTVGTTDAAGVAVTHQRTPTDTTGVTDTGTSLAFLRDGTSTVGVTDVAAPVLTVAVTARTVNDTIGVADAGVSTAVGRFGADTVAVTDVVQASLGTATVTRTINDVVEVRDADDPETVSLTETVSVADTVGVTDTVTPVKTAQGVAVTCRSTVGVSASAATQLRSVADLATWSAKWDAIPIVGPNTGDGGWRAGDGMWSVTHPNGASAIFSFGDTPVSRITPVVLTGTSATVQGTQSAWVTVLDGSAASFPDGSRVRVYLSDGSTLRYGATVTRRITGRNSAFGYTNLMLDYALPSAPAVGDVVKGATGGEEWWMFPPHSSAVLWTNGQMRNVAGIDSWIPRDDPASWYWAGPMVMDGNDLYVFPSKQDNTAAPWADVGRGLWKFDWDNHAASPTGATKIATWGLDPCWGAAVVKQGSYFYIFGTYRYRGDPLNGNAGAWFDNEVYVARTTSMATAPTAWEFWTSTGGGTWATGSGYLTSRAGLQVVVPQDNVNGLENTFSAHYDNGLFVLASKRGGVFGSDVALWTSTTITGPYTRRVVGSAPNDTPTANDQTYLTNAHFNLPRLPNGKVLISVSRNRDGQTIQSFFDTDPSWYRPLWLEADTTVRAVTARATVGAVPRAVAAHRATPVARATVGTTTVTTARHVSTVVARGVAGAAVSTTTAIRPTVAVVARSAVGQAATVTARHVAGGACRSDTGVVSSAAARKATPGGARSAAGAAATAVVAHLAGSSARATVAAVATGAVGKRTAATGASRVGTASWLLLTGGRLVGTRSVLGAQAVVAGVGHRTVVVTRSVTGAYAAVSARKVAPGVSGAAAGSVASTVVRKAAPAVSRGVAGAQAHVGAVGHRAAAVAAVVAGVSGTAGAAKRTATAARGVLGAQGRHSGTLARAVAVTSAAGFQTVTGAYKAAVGVFVAPVGVWARAGARHVATPTTTGVVGGVQRASVTHKGTATTTAGVAGVAAAAAGKRASGTVRGALTVASAAGARRRVPVSVYSASGGVAWATPGPQPITGGTVTGGERDDTAGFAASTRVGPSMTQTERRVPALTGGSR